MIRKDIKSKIREYFFLNPTTKLRVRQIEREIKVPFPSVIRYTKELEAEGILRTQITSGVKFYSADRSSKKFLLEKKLFNIKQLHDSELINYLIKECFNHPIIVFGSYSKGEDIEESDIDLYVETPSQKKPKLTRFEKTLRRSIQIFGFKSINQIKNKELANNIMNGIPINGFVEVFK